MAVIDNNESDTLLSGTNSNDRIENSGNNVIINSKGGNDTISTGTDYSSRDSNVTVNSGSGDDSIFNANSNALVNGDSGRDSILNTSFNVTINGGAGNDYIENISGSYDQGDSVTIAGGDGNDTIFNGGGIYPFIGGEEVSINGGNGNDYVYNDCADYVTIDCGAGNDSVYNDVGSYCTINTGLGNDLISLRAYSSVIIYNSGDGNDKIYGFNGDDTISIVGGTYSTKKSGDNVIVTIGTGKITLIGAAGLETLNIKGKESNIFSNVNATDLGGETKESVRTKAIAGLETLLKTDMSDVVLKNVDGLKTLDDSTRKKLSSLASIFKLANEAESSFGVLGNMCASAETFLGLVQSKKRDATWGKQVSDCVKNLLKFGNAVLKLSDKKLAKSLGLGLGGSLFGLVGSIVATTDGITDTERDNIVKDVFSVGGEFAKLTRCES